MSGDRSAAGSAGGGGNGGSGPRGGSRGHHRLLKLVVALAVVLVGVRVLKTGAGTQSGPPSPSQGTLSGSWSGPAATALPRSVPLRVQVPSVGINAPLVRLGLDADGGVAVPPMSVPTEAGWFTGDPTPGESGAAKELVFVYADEEAPPEYGRFANECPVPAAFALLLSRSPCPGSVPLSSVKMGEDAPLAFLRQLLLGGEIHVSP